MQYIKGAKISFEYGGEEEPLFTDISFEINKNNKIGLIGKNGCGKTTLFKIMQGEYKPLQGTLHLQDGIKIGFLPQEIALNEEIKVVDFLWQARPSLYACKQKIDKCDDYKSSAELKMLSEFEDLGGYNFENTFNKTLSQFEYGKDILNRTIESLSGGEKTKIVLCQIILKEPNVLLLDEPTNHLDLETLMWLETYLKKTAIPFVVISHDRKFLDNCVSCIWELDTKELKTYSGNYSFYKYEKDIEYKRNLKLYEKQQQKIKQLETATGKRRIDANRMENFKLSRSVKKNGSICKRDDGSGSGKSDPSKKMRSAKALEKRVEMMLEREEAKKPFLEKKREIAFNQGELKNKNVLQVENMSMTFISKKVFENLNLIVANGAKLAVVGRNGSGKSTLFKILTGQLENYCGSYKWAPKANIAYYSQEHDNLNQKNTILEEVIQGRYNEQTNARTILACLNLCRDKVHQKISTLSIGERSKVALAKIILSEANVLILDEPVNHLEISAREALEEALMAFTGTIIFVSHDRYFRDKIATDVFDMDRYISL